MKNVRFKRLVIVVEGKRYFYDVHTYKGGGKIVIVRPAGNQPAFKQNGRPTWIHPSQNICEFYHQKNGQCRRKQPAKEKQIYGVKGAIPYDKKFIDAYVKRIEGASAVIKPRTAEYWNKVV